MDIGKTLYVTDRKQWRSWLAKNGRKEKDIWLVFYRKSSGKPRILYNDAVEEALCYGWIDSIVKKVDDASFAQRFSPRRPKSVLSEMNKERIRRLIRSKKMTKRGLRALQGLFDHEKDKRQKLIVSHDILRAIKADRKAWNHFQKMPEGYKKVRIGYIESRRRQGKEQFKNSLDHFVRKTAKNRMFGMVR